MSEICLAVEPENIQLQRNMCHFNLPMIAGWKSSTRWSWVQLVQRRSIHTIICYSGW